jgi:hypothetical protein
MIARKKEFSLGLGLLVAFFVVLFIFFSPVFNGHNGLDYLDNLYNSISKGSAYYIPKLKDDSKAFNGSAVEMSFAMASPLRPNRPPNCSWQAHSQCVRPSSRCRGPGQDPGQLPGRYDAMYKTTKGLTAKYGYNGARHSTTGGRPSKGSRRT